MSFKSHPVVDQMAALVGGHGDPCDFGCKEEDIDAMIARATELFPGKPCSVVANWCWGDIEIHPNDALKLRETGVEPAFVFADTVVYDQANRWPKGSCVRTSFLVEFHHPCIFSTRNTSYILLGPGTRMTVMPEVFIQLCY